MLIIAGHAHVDAEQRDAYVASFRDLQERSRQAAGCLDVFISADSVDPTRVNIFERWESQEALEAWRERVNPPEVAIEMTSEEVKLYTALDERSPFE